MILTRKCIQIGLAAILITIGFPIRTENTLLAEEYQYPAQISRITLLRHTSLRAWLDALVLESFASFGR